MAKFLTEDVVRDNCKEYLGFNFSEPNVKQGTGQLTTFNKLGIKGDNNKPDGWYLPDNQNDVAIILETKNSNEDVGAKKWIDEIKKNCSIVMNAGWTKVVGLLHNGYKTQGFLNNQPIDVPDEIQSKRYYIELVDNRIIDKEKIYTITARINNCLHVDFGVKNLYHRMIFTACALVAERYGAKLENVKDMGYNVFRNRVFDVLSKSLEKDKQQNSKISIVLDVYSEIKMNIQENQNAINNFIDCICEIYDCINSNEWRGEDVMGIFFNEFNRYKPKSEAGQVFTPDHITSFMYRLLDVNENDYVGDFCCGSGAFLVKSMSKMMKATGGYNTNKAKEIRQKHLFGIEFDREIFALACANMMIHKDGKTNFEQMDTRTDEACEWIRSKPITKVLMNPPYENKYGCIKIVENVLDSVKPGTDCAFILPDKKFEKVSKSAVKRILSYHRITKIIKLPEPLFFGIGMTTSIFVFKAGEPQNENEIFGCYIEEDGLETVKNQGRHDIRNKWQANEDYWIESINKLRDLKFHTDQWINPSEHLSYQMPENPFEINEEDFRKTAMDYQCFKKGIDVKDFGERLLNVVLYSKKMLINKFSNDTYETSGMVKNDTHIWEKFLITNMFDLFLPQGDLQVKKVEDGTIPLITPANSNNGLLRRISALSKSTKFSAETLTVDMFGNAYYQEEDFFVTAHGHVNVLVPKFKINKLIGLFIATAIRTMFMNKYGFKDMCTQKVLKKETVSLPVSVSGIPDWAYMESCMKQVMEESENKIECLKACLE